MKIHIKTSLITLTIEDEPAETGSSYARHSIPELLPAIKAAVDEALRLHDEANKLYEYRNS